MSQEKRLNDCGPLVPEWIEQLCQGNLSAKDAARLEQCVIEDPAARQYYIRYLHLHTVLPLVVQASPPERSASVAASGHPAERSPLLGFLAAGVRMLPGGEFTVGALLLAVVVSAFAGLAMILRARSHDPHFMAGQVNEPAPVRLTSAKSCRWRSVAPELGATVEGQSLELDAGLAQFKLGDYVEMLVEGPASLKVISPSRVWLGQGKLVATALPKGAGFTVLTADAEVVDLGTEFGVEATPGGTTQVRVFQGLVRVEPRSSVQATRPGAFVICAGESRQISVSPDTGRSKVTEPEVARTFVRRLEPRVPARWMLAADAVVVKDSGVQLLESVENSHFRAARGDLLETRLDPRREVEPAADTKGTFPGQRLDALFDGRLYAGPVNGDENHTGGSFSPSESQGIEFYLDVEREPQGYDIVRIDSVTGWTVNRLSQRYSVFVRFRGDPEFEPRPLATVQVDVPWKDGAAELKVSTAPRTAPCLASGVDAIRFVFHDKGSDEPQGSVYREIDVFGLPSSDDR